MGILRTELLIPQRRDTVFGFFADAENLEAITPEWLRFSIVSKRPIEMRAGARIEYKLRIRGVPVRWESEITVWEPPLRFVDEQRRGPYRKWRHEHLFEQRPGGTAVIDQVEYKIPGGVLVERFFVRPEVNRIFDFRQRKLREIFKIAPSEVRH